MPKWPATFSSNHLRFIPLERSLSCQSLGSSHGVAPRERLFVIAVAFTFSSPTKKEYRYIRMSPSVQIRGDTPSDTSFLRFTGFFSFCGVSKPPINDGKAGSPPFSSVYQVDPYHSIRELSIDLCPPTGFIVAVKAIPDEGND